MSQSVGRPPAVALRSVRHHLGFLALVCLSGALIWLFYLAVQPRAYFPHGGSKSLETILGWRAPIIGLSETQERDRFVLAGVAWLLIGVVAGRLRPTLWPLIGPLALVVAIVFYFPTSPRDAEGWWRLNFFLQLLPTVAAVSAAAWVGSRLPIFEDRLLFASAAVAALTAGLLGSGEPGDKLIFILVAATALAAVRAYRLSEEVRTQAAVHANANRPVLRATTQQGDVYDDPSEDLLYKLMSDMEDGAEEYFAVQRLANPLCVPYAQVFRDGDHWLLERREGDRHFRAVFSDRRAAHSVLAAWTFELPGWDDLADWQQLPA